MNNEQINLATLAEHFADADKARELIEKMLWKDGVTCPHCNSKTAYRIQAKEGSKSGARKGLWKCAECRKQFTVTVGTIFEDSRIPLNKWLLAIHLLCSSKKGFSAHQLHRSLGITYKSAWFLAHRIRYAMTQEPMFSKLNGTVEVDETYVGVKLEADEVVFKIKIGDTEEVHTFQRESGLPVRIEIVNMDYNETAVFSDMPEYYKYFADASGTSFELEISKEHSDSDRLSGGSVNDLSFCHPIDGPGD